MTEDPELTAYRGELRNVIVDSGMILDAANYRDANDEAASAFELTSGACVRQFISLWNLFNWRDRHDHCVRMFARMAREIRAAKPYSAIVTCGVTSKHILEQSHAEIESEGEKVALSYLGFYPHLSLDHESIFDIRDQRVLIATGVVASGDFVRRLAEIVVHLGGRPIAAACIVITGPDLIADPRLRLESGQHLLLHSLTDFEIPLLQTGEYERSCVRRIDPVTILPEEIVRLPDRFSIFFDKRQMFEHFERANAIDFDFHQVDAQRFTTGVRINKLLESCGDEIWSRLSQLLVAKSYHNDRISDKPVLVTTIDMQDMSFTRFIESRMSDITYDTVIVPKRDAVGAPFRHFLLHQDVRKLEGRHAVLLLSSIHTLERLCDLTSLLVSQSVSKITVVCLLNRMGLQSLNFITRVAQMLGGVGVLSAHRDFEFLAVYDLPDFSADSILKIQESPQELLHRYTSLTRVYGFRRLIDQDRKYFRSQSVTSYDFSHRRSRELTQPFSLTLGAEAVTVKSQDAAMLLLCIYMVTVRDYRPTIDFLRSASDKKTIYQLFAVLLADVNYLKMNGAFEEWRAALIRRIRELRDRRFEVERLMTGDFTLNPNSDEILTESSLDLVASLVERESHYMFGLALLSHLDETFDYRRTIDECLFCNLPVDEWAAYPVNLLSYLGGERIALCLSMLINLAYLRLDNSENWKSFKGSMGADILSFISKLEQQPSLMYDDAKIKLRLKVKANLSLLVKEMGDNGRKEKHQIIRYLHSKIMSSHLRHNPIMTSLINVQHVLADVVESNVVGNSAAEGRNRRFQIDLRARAKQTLEDAMYTAGILQETAEASRDLFMFTLSRNGQSSRFTAGPSEKGLARDIMKLGDLLQFARSSNSVSKADVEAITEIRTRISEDLWSSHSELQQALRTYVVPLTSYLLAALEWANEQLASKYGEVWRRVIGSIGALNREYYVLADPHLLREILKNVVLNVRHQFTSFGLQPNKDYSQMVDVEFVVVDDPISEPDGQIYERMEYVCLRVISRGTEPMQPSGDMPRATTFSKHASDILEYGGKMTLSPLSDGGVVVEIKLMSRQSLAESLGRQGERRLI